MPEDSNISIIVALRVLSELYRTNASVSHLSAVALRGLAENVEERVMSLDNLACAVIVREHSRL